MQIHSYPQPTVTIFQKSSKLSFQYYFTECKTVGEKEKQQAV